LKFNYVLSPKPFKLVDISRKSETRAKNSYGSYPTVFVFEVKDARLIPSVIQKEFERIFQKAGGQNFSFGHP
jgi:hypothetical protein